MTGFPADLYAGTAEYYERFRPRYPDVMLAEVRERVGVGGTLVDLACGTGQIAVPLAPYFDRVLAVDLEPEMVDMGREVADQAGIVNIRWQVGRAEYLVLDAGSVDLLTIGTAFHRLDRHRIAELAKEWLRPGGALVLMCYGPPPNSAEPKSAWQEITSRVIKKWTGPQSEATKRALAGPVHEEVLASAGYTIEHYQCTVPRTWTLDELVGLTFSISVSSKRRLGEQTDAFEAELRSELLNYDSSGQYKELLPFAAIIARPSDHKPANK